MPLDAPTVLYLLTAVHQMHGEHVMQECGIDMHSSICIKKVSVTGDKYECFFSFTEQL
jgi:hypothetical protein